MKILIIDDEPEIRQTLAFVLEDEGYETYTAGTGFEGLKNVESQKFDIVITDLRLPDLDGMEIVGKVKKIHPDTIVVMITGHFSIENAVEAIRAGADDYIPKPLNAEEVLMKLDKAIEMRRLKDENLLFHRHLEMELEIARKIQQTLLPQQPPIVAGLDIGIFNQPAKQVGGDYHDLIVLPTGELGIAIGDVSGKGMPAALLMANVQASIRRCSEHKHSPMDIMKRINDALCPICQFIEEHRFVTLFCSILDPSSGELIYSNAGHNYPLVFKQNGTIYPLSASGGIPCGILEDACYDEARIKLEPYDIVIFYTDGITESMNSDGIIFGEERLIDIVSKNLDLDSNAIINCMYEEISRFIVDSPQYDDMTIMAVKLTADEHRYTQI
jgi:serine phosphatase RsbU (regulator of sigma subunit)